MTTELNPILDLKFLLQTEKTNKKIFKPNLTDEKKYMSFNWESSNLFHIRHFYDCVLTENSIDALRMANYIQAYLNKKLLGAIDVEPDDEMSVYELNIGGGVPWNVFHYCSNNPNHKRSFSRNLLFKDTETVNNAYVKLEEILRQKVQISMLQSKIDFTPKLGEKIYTVDFLMEDLYAVETFNPENYYHIFLLFNGRIFKSKEKAIEKANSIIKSSPIINFFAD